MTQINLPFTPTGKDGKEATYGDVYSPDLAIANVVNGELDSDNLSPNAGIEHRQLAADAKSPVTWYTPKIISGEESRTNTAYGTLGTADEIPGVVLPTNGLIAIAYRAVWKSSASEAGHAAIFIGSNQLKLESTNGTVTGQEIESLSTGFTRLVSGDGGLARTNKVPAADVTTGQILGTGLSTAEGPELWVRVGSGASQSPKPGAWGGLCYVFAAAGNYNISVQYKASSGSVTAKERKLWVAVLGS